MTQYADRFHSHPLHQALRALQESIDSEFLELPEGETRDGYDRFLRIVAFFRRSLGQCDPALVSAGGLSTLQAKVEALRAAHDAFKQNKDVSALNVAADALLEHLHLLPRLSDGVQEFAAAVDDLRGRSNSALDALAGRHAELDNQRSALADRLKSLEGALAEQEKRLEGQKQRFDALITDHQNKFNTEQGARNEQFNAAQTGRDKEHAETRKILDAALTTLTKQGESQQSAFDTAQDKRTESFQKALSQGEALLKASLEAHGKESESQRQAVASRADEIMGRLQEHLDHAKRIVGLIGSTGMTGHYQKVANREWWAAEVFRGMAVIFFILLVAGVGWVVKEIRAEDFNWEVALFRIAVSLTLIAPAWYCARESTRHRRVENRNRRIELELAAINPFLESLPIEKSQAVIERLAGLYFGHANRDEAANDDGRIVEVKAGDVMDIVERTAKIVRR